MPLMIMSPNIAQRNSPSSRKRSHDEYSEHYDSDGPVKAEPQHLVKMEPEDRGMCVIKIQSWYSPIGPGSVS